MEIIRKWVQIVFVFLTNGYWGFPFTRSIYQGPLKILCSPGLNCYSCPAATTYCPIGSLQQLLGGIRFSLETGQYFVGWSVVGTLGIIGGFWGRMICGWVCPFGFVQELLHKIPSVKYGIYPRLKYLKYVVLALFVVILPLFALDEFASGSPWFCKYICPAGTLEAGIPMLLMQPNLRSTAGYLFLNKFIIMILFIGWSVVASRPFCRTTCPLGAFYAFFSKVKLVKLRLIEENCTQCEACHSVCPMGVKFNEEPESTECISCLKCMNQACKFEAITLEVGGVPLQSPRRKRPVGVVEAP